MQSAENVLYAVRFLPGEDVKVALKRFADEKGILAGSILSAVGSLETANIRLAKQQSGLEFPGPFEIVAMTGTISKNGLHIHIAISDLHGRTIGGHLCDGSTVLTTLELTIVEAKGLVFHRVPDAGTGYLELVINPR